MRVVGSARLRSIAYRSLSTTPFGPAELEALAMNSAGRNGELDVTGFLVHREGQFVQYLEGPGEAIDALYPRIEGDDRHQVVTTMDVPVVARRFGGWGMEALDPSWLPTVHHHDVLYELLTGRPSPDRAAAVAVAVDAIAVEYQRA